MQKKVILFIHGFMGSPKQFDRLTKQLADCGADMLCLTLPGHGAGVEEFIKSGAEDWQEAVNEAIDRLRRDYDCIYLVGHSMGGLLAVLSAIKCSDKLCKVAALGFPIRVRVTYSWLSNAIRASRPPNEGEPVAVSAARELSGVNIPGVGAYLRTLPSAAAFFGVVKKCGRELSKLKTPLIIINSQLDEIVSPTSQSFVEKRLPNAEFLMLPASGHFWFTPEDEEFILNRLKAMIAQDD